MNTLGVLLMAAVTATGGINKPYSNKHWLRPHAVIDGPAPPGGAGCLYGHPGCGGGQACPGPGGAGGAGGPGGPGQMGRRFPNTRSQIWFVDPTGMHIGWQTSTGGPERVYLPAQLTVPARYNFTQGYIYRLKLTDIPNRPNLALYPTIEVAPSTPATDAYITHNPIPAQFTEEDFDQVQAGNFVTKVIYLPDPRYQELAIAGVETLVSTRLEPGVDPILEADRRGTILMIVRLGAINLEVPAGGESVPAGTMTRPATVLPPGSLPPGVVPGAPGMIGSGPVDVAPVAPAPPGAASPFVPPAPQPGATGDIPPPIVTPPGAEGTVPVPGATPPPARPTEPAPGASPGA